MTFRFNGLPTLGLLDPGLWGLLVEVRIEGRVMELIVIIVVLLLLFGGGGFYGYRGGAFSGPGPGIIGLIVMIILIVLVIRLLGGAA